MSKDDIQSSRLNYSRSEEDLIQRVPDHDGHAQGRLPDHDGRNQGRVPDHDGHAQGFTDSRFPHGRSNGRVSLPPQGRRHSNKDVETFPF